MNDWASKNSGASEKQFSKFLNNLAKEPEYVAWISKSVPATQSYWSRAAGRAGVGLAVVGVASVALRAESIAESMRQNICDLKNGDGWGAIGLNQDMQDLAPGFAGHTAWLIAIGQM